MAVGSGVAVPTLMLVMTMIMMCGVVADFRNPSDTK